jgi:hypothetical protein
LIYLKGRHATFCHSWLMFAPMAPGRRLAGLICAAILMIAIQFVANPASAHADHAHHAKAPASSVAIPDHHVCPAVDGTLQTAQRDTTSFAVSNPDHPDVAASSASGCTGGCCGNGLGCCGAVLAPTPSALHVLETASEAMPLGVGRSSGLNPEILPEPPKALV